MVKKIDLTGQRFGRLTVIREADRRADGRVEWHCACDCGKEIRTQGARLRSGGVKSCGCIRLGVGGIDLTGQRFGKLAVIEEADRSEGGERRWLCRCDCGNESEPFGAALRKGSSRSCGCVRRKHGLTDTRLHAIWATMLARTSNPNATGYENYGGRGISVCARWKDPGKGFLNFHADMGEPPSSGMTLDRMDNDGPYAPENCRWATIEEQGRNRRTNVVLTFKGRSLTVTEWAEELGIPRSRIYRRIEMGWSHERALSR